jgi:hypothetical protein
MKHLCSRRVGEHFHRLLELEAIKRGAACERQQKKEAREGFLSKKSTQSKSRGLEVIDDDIASHNGFAAVGFCGIDAFLAESFDGFAQDVNRLRGCIASCFFFNELLHFAGNNQNICHVCLHSIRIKVKPISN